MPVEFEWHSELPILIASYQVIANDQDVKDTVGHRAELLSENAVQFVFLADMQACEFDAFEYTPPFEESVLSDEHLVSLLVVVSDAVYGVVTRAGARTGTEGHRVQFFASVNDALAQAASLLQR